MPIISRVSDWVAIALLMVIISNLILLTIQQIRIIQRQHKVLANQDKIMKAQNILLCDIGRSLDDDPR